MISSTARPRASKSEGVLRTRSQEVVLQACSHSDLIIIYSCMSNCFIGQCMVAERSQKHFSLCLFVHLKSKIVIFLKIDKSKKTLQLTEPEEVM